MTGFDCSGYPHILANILSHVSLDTLPALRGVNKAIGKWAESHICKHVVVQVSNKGKIDLLDPFVHRRVAGLRFAPGDDNTHKPTLRRLAAHTTTFDFIGDCYDLNLAPGWGDIRAIACGKRVRCITPVSQHFKTPADVVWHRPLTVKYAAWTPRPDHSSPSRALTIIKVTSAWVTPGPTATRVRMTFSFSHNHELHFARDRVVLLDPSEYTPPVISAPFDNHSCLGTLLDWMTHRDDSHYPITLVVPDLQDENAPHGYAEVQLAITSWVTANYNIGHQPKFKMVTMADYRRSSGIDGDEWDVIMAKPGVKLPLPGPWSVAGL